MSKLKDLLERVAEFDYAPEEDADIAERAEAAVTEQTETSQRVQDAAATATEAQTLAGEAEARASEAEVRASEAETRAEEAEARASEAEADAVRGITQLMEGVRSELQAVTQRLDAAEEWRTGVSERYGLVPSSDDEAANRAGSAADEPLVPDEDFVEARKHADGQPLDLFRRIMSRFKEKYGPVYDVPGAEERTSERTLNTIRAMQAVRTPAERPQWI